MKFLEKIKGVSQSPPPVSVREIFLSWLGAFLGVGMVGLINNLMVGAEDNILMITSFGASSVLLYGAPKSPLAQPRNLVGGHLLAAFIGVAIYKAFFFELWFASALTVATAVAVMHLTRTLHPPAGATALFAVIGGPSIHQMGFFYPIFPVAIGVVILLAVALVFNNLSKNRRYPQFWV